MYSAILDLPASQAGKIDDIAGELRRLMPVDKVLGAGGCIVLPGSVNADGKRYPLPVHSDYYLAHLKKDETE